jgi:lipopolysaccharide transport system ATP-binding protein
MSDIAISVENLSKAYRISHRRDGGHSKHRTLREDLVDLPKKLMSRFTGNGSSKSEEFWALKDVSFEVKEGEVLGVIGRNGAGKSTLLKILSRISEPTSGRALVYGRVGSLLEVGTGFHQELTGRENIFLNGAILGMARAEIRAQFDEIVAFAEVEKFLDTPVKHYSSGMYVRLAFAVAAHLDPEILIVDEVLAVGDAEFQRKCLGKMQEVSERQGRTVLFVSHNMPAITRLCSRAILLHNGHIQVDADATSATRAYLNSGVGSSAERIWSIQAEAPGDDVVRLRAVRVMSEGRITDAVDIRKAVVLELEYWNFKPSANLISAFTLFNEDGVILFVSADWHERSWGSKPRPIGIYHSRCTIPGNLLAEGRVRVLAEVSTRHPYYQLHVWEGDVVSFFVVDHRAQGSVAAGWGRPLPGVVRPMLEWSNQHHALDADDQRFEECPR